jgi:DNA-binding YbaB/EbfC family protein
MAKGNPFGGGMPNIPGLGNMMKQVQKMAEDTQRMEEELGNERIEVASGGGMVKATVNGKGELLELKIDKEVVDPDDVEMLEDLVVSAVREALEKADAHRAERVQEITGGINIPGLF